MLAIRLMGYCLLAWSNNTAPAGGLGVTAFGLVGPLELGVSASGETDFPTTNRIQLASHLGLRIAPIDAIELDAAATLGYADITNGKGGFFSDDPGASGSLGFVGGRAGAAWVFFRSPDRETLASLGLIASYEHDLGRYTAHYSYLHDGWLSDETTVEQDWAPIGSDRTALLVALGLGFN